MSPALKAWGQIFVDLKPLPVRDVGVFISPSVSTWSKAPTPDRIFHEPPGCGMTQQWTQAGHELDRALFFFYCFLYTKSTVSRSSGPDGDLPHPDKVVCVASKQGLRRERESGHGKGWVANKVRPWDTRTKDSSPRRANPKSEEGPPSAPDIGEIKISKVERGPREGRDRRSRDVTQERSTSVLTVLLLHKQQEGPPKILMPQGWDAGGGRKG